MATYESFVENWRERVGQASQAGISIQKLVPIIQRDFERLQRGEEPMDSSQALATVISAGTNRPLIAEPRRKTGLFDIAGNIPSDIAGIVRGLFPPNLIKTVYREGQAAREWVTNPEQREDQGNPFRNIAAVPGLRFLLPGVTTAANLTTPEGRQQIAQHPVTTFLDVLPIAKGIGRTGAIAAEAAGVVDPATVGRKVAATQAARELGREALLPPTSRLTRPEALYAAAAQGRPVGAVLEATGLRPTVDKALNPITEWLRTSTRLSRGHAVEVRKAQNAINDFNKKWNSVWQRMSKDERDLLGKEWTQPDLYPASSPEHAAIIDAGRHLQRQFGFEGTRIGDLFPVKISGETVFYSKTGHDAPVWKSLQAQTRAEDRLTSIRKKLSTTSDPIKRAQLQADEQAALTAAQTARHDLLTSIRNTAPAAFYPMLKEQIRESAIGGITGLYNNAKILRPQLDAALESIRYGDFVNAFAGVADPTLVTKYAARHAVDERTARQSLGKREFDKLVQGIESGWLDLIRQGYSPVFLHNVPDWKAATLSRARVIGYYEYTPGQFRSTALTDMTPHYTDVAVGLSVGAAEYLNRAANRNFLERHVLPRGLLYDEAFRITQPQIDRLIRKGYSPEKAKDRVFRESFEKVDNIEEAFAFSGVRAHANMAGRTVYFPKTVYKAAVDLTKARTPQSKFGRITVRGNSLFKTSLFAFSLRHAADETFGNLMLISLRGSRETFSPSTISTAFRMARRDQLPDELSRSIDIVPAEQIHRYALGKTLGRLFGSTRLDSLHRYNEFINSVQRSMSYLGERKRQQRLGMPPEVATDIAIRHANKAVVDFDSFLPFERQIVRQIVPFYSWIRFLSQYLLTYPTDHPLRASIISKIAAVESDDEASGLPKYFSHLFQLSEPDPQGNVSASDARVLNPFRDAYNLFTWAGFFSALGPQIAFPLEVAGVQTLSGTPELYPELTYNTETGRLEAKRLNIASRSGAIELLSSFLPPVGGTIDHIFQLSDRLRRLHASDPVAYRRQLFTALGIPFVPYTENLSLAHMRQQRQLVEAARKKVSNATRQTGSTTDLRRYAVVPWQGQIVSGPGLADLIDQLHEVSADTGIPVRMLMHEVAKVVT